MQISILGSWNFMLFDNRQKIEWGTYMKKRVLLALFMTIAIGSFVLYGCDKKDSDSANVTSEEGDKGSEDADDGQAEDTDAGKSASGVSADSDGSDEVDEAKDTADSLDSAGSAGSSSDDAAGDLASDKASGNASGTGSASGSGSDNSSASGSDNGTASSAENSSSTGNGGPDMDNINSSNATVTAVDDEQVMVEPGDITNYGPITDPVLVDDTEYEVTMSEDGHLIKTPKQ